MIYLSVLGMAILASEILSAYVFVALKNENTKKENVDGMKTCFHLFTIFAIILIILGVLL